MSNKDAKIAVISAKWNDEIVTSAENSFVNEMVAKGYSKENIKIIKAPGALEIPLIGLKALQADYDLAVGISFIVNGLIYRHEFVAQAVVDGIVNSSLETNKPFLSVCLAPQAFNEHSPENRDFFVNHMVIKGREAAEAADDVLNLSL